MGILKDIKSKVDAKKKARELIENRKIDELVGKFRSNRIELLKKYVQRMPNDVWAITLSDYPLEILIYQKHTVRCGDKKKVEVDYRDNIYEVFFALTSIYPFVKSDYSSNTEMKTINKYAGILLDEKSIAQYDDNIFKAVGLIDDIWNTKIPHEFFVYTEFDHKKIDKNIQLLVKRIEAEKQRRIEEKEKEQEVKEREEIETERREQEELKMQKIKEAGDKGEADVSYALRYLDGYIIIDKNNNGGNPVRLLNSDYIDEEQEIDHIAIGKVGVIHIETKAYSGKLIIDEEGNWSREKDNKYEGIENPLQQIRRHEKVLKSIIGDIPIYSLICIAKNNAIIQGGKNSKIPVVKADMLVEKIEEIERKNEHISKETIDNTYQLICKHVIRRES